MEDHHPATVSGPITDAEQTYLIDYLQTTRDSLRQSLAGLTHAQQQFRPAPGRWTIAECAEHIALVDYGLFRSLQQAMNVPDDPARRSAMQCSDVFVIKAVRSRTNAIAAPTPFVPTGRYADVAAALDAFEQQRADTIEYVQTAPGDYRTHYTEHPFLGTLDGFQTLLTIASHGERHRKQIEEIKATPGFPT